MTINELVTEYEERTKAIFKVYDMMMESVSVNEAGEASAEETLQAIDFCYTMEELNNKWFKEQIQALMEGDSHEG